MLRISYIEIGFKNIFYQKLELFTIFLNNIRSNKLVAA